LRKKIRGLFPDLFPNCDIKNESFSGMCDQNLIIPQRIAKWHS
jgi:hypothetical protein